MTGTPVVEWLNKVRAEQRRQTVYLWGQPSSVKPVILRTVFGDGGQLIGLAPIMLRPRYYLVRIDNRWHTSNFARCPEELRLCEHLDEIYEAIEDEFGRAEEEWEHDNGRTYRRRNPWPAADISDGCAWWTECHFIDLREGEED